MDDQHFLLLWTLKVSYRQHEKIGNFSGKFQIYVLRVAGDFIYHSLSPASISMLVTCYVRPVPIKGFWIIHSFVYTNHKYHYKTSITVHHTRTPSHSSSEHSVSIKIEEWMCDSFHISFLEMRCDPVLSRLSNIFRSHWGRGSGGQWDWDPDKM